MTAPTTTTVCMPWCADRGQHHPDNHCVQADVEILDLYGNQTSIAAYAEPALQQVGVYVGSLLYRPADARAYAAALLNAADAADQARRIFNGAEVAR